MDRRKALLVIGGLLPFALSSLILVFLDSANVQASTDAVILVDSTADDFTPNGNCTLREAIIAANIDFAVDNCAAGTGEDTITLPSGTYILSIPGTGEDMSETGDLDIRDALTINGAGAETTIIDANGIDRVIQIHSIGDGFQVNLKEITIQNGVTTEGPWSDGGGIWNGNELTLVSSKVLSNTSVTNGGGLANPFGGTLTSRITNTLFSNNTAGGNGGGLYTHGPVFIQGVTVIENHADLDGGGVWVNDDVLHAYNTTIARNSTTNHGGGIYTGHSGDAYITNSTISGNTADGSGGGLFSPGRSYLRSASITGNVTDSDGDGTGSGGGIFQENWNVLVRNTIIANNLANPTIPSDCVGELGGFVSEGYNLIGAIDDCNWSMGTGDINGTRLSPLDPLFNPLSDNGGEGLTHGLAAGSPALDVGNPASPGSGGEACETTDQRGVLRPQGTRCDIGAYESQLAVSKTASGLFEPGTVLTYTISLNSQIGSAIPGVTLTDSLPATLTYLNGSLSFTNGNGGESAGVITWTGDVALSTATTITFNATLTNTVPRGFIVENTAEISSSDETLSGKSLFQVPFLNTYLPVGVKFYPPQPIAFVSDRNTSGLIQTSIYVMNSDGSGQIGLTGNMATDTNPSWSPDRRQIAFTSNRDSSGGPTGFNIYAMNADGSNQTNLTHQEGEYNSLVWAPDGSKIYYWSNRNGNGDIYVMNPDGTNQINLTNHPDYDNTPSLSPDEAHIVFERGEDIYIMNSDGSGVQNLTNNPSYDSVPVISTSGDKIAFSSVRDSGPPELYVMDIDGSNVQRLTNNQNIESCFTWSPDGTKISYKQDGALYIVDAVNGGPIFITSGAGGFSSGPPQWSRDGRILFFDAFRNSDWEILAVNLQSLNETNLSNNPSDDQFPIVSP